MKKLGIGARIAGGFAIVVTMFVFNHFFAAYSIVQLTHKLKTLDEDATPSVLTIHEMETDRSRVQQSLADVSATHDRAGYKVSDAAEARFLAGVSEFRKRYEQDGDADTLRALKSIEEKFLAFKAKGREMAETYITMGIASGNLLMKGNDTVVGFAEEAEALTRELTEFNRRQRAQAEKQANGARIYAGNIVDAMIFGSLAAIVLATIIFVAIARSVTVPMAMMQSAIAAICRDGDFTRRVAVKSRDETGQTSQSLNELVSKLQVAFQLISEGVEKFTSSADSLSSCSKGAADRSVNYKESSAAIAAVASRVTLDINKVSRSAHEAGRLSRQSCELSDKGGETIHHAAQEMMKISDSVSSTSESIRVLGTHSNQISALVKVIKDIAEQTNLLALNAAIEAARAGEMGRGFAVVADEVRKLADRTAKATQQVSEMIGSLQHWSQNAVHGMSSMVEQVNGGVALAREAGEAITRIKLVSNQITTMIVDVANTLEEQGKSTDEISAQIEKVSDIAEIDSSLARQVSDKALQLQQLAEELRTAVGRFKVW